MQLPRIVGGHLLEQADHWILVNKLDDLDTAITVLSNYFDLTIAGSFHQNKIPCVFVSVTIQHRAHECGAHLANT